MAKFRMKKGTLVYKGQQYNPGDILELEEFDNSLPINWFEEIAKEPETKRKKETKTNKKPIIEEVIEDGDNDFDTD